MADFYTQVFTSVSLLLPEVMMSIDEMSLRTGALQHVRNFDPPNAEEWLARLATNLEREHPGIAYVRRGGTERVLRLSDFMTQRQLRDTALYQENYKDTGIEHQVALVLPITDYVAGLAVNRSSKFSEREVTLLKLLGPHIARAHSNARLFSALQAPSGAAEKEKRVELSASLTPREREVFHWLVQGKRDREIATILGASHRTIHKHVQNILSKLGVETRSAAAAMASGIS